MSYTWATPAVPDWDRKHTTFTGSCGTCGRTTGLRFDPLSRHPVCKACFEALLVWADEDKAGKPE